jgi:4-hydroxybenzoate polyprenyltransferase
MAPTEQARIATEEVTAAAVPLVIDLDGTLCRSDSLHETLAGLAAREPGALLGVARRLGAGKAAVKGWLGDRGVLPGEALPYRDEVLELARAAKAEGRAVVLVSAADQRQVAAVAAHLGLFDAAFGTGDATGGGNLSGRAKRDFLVARYGAGGFDYAGDAAVDLPVWQAARRAYTVGAGAALRRAAERANAECRHLAPRTGRAWRPWARALRPHQWSKNLLVFLPMLAAHDLSGLVPVLAAFVAFSLTASSVYLVNDILDLPADRAHPRKRFRPFAAGEIAIRDGVLLAGGLVAAAVAISLALAPPLFLGVLALYYVTTFAYSFWLKRKLTIDVITLAALYTLRILGGAAAASVVLSPWMLGFSMFLFLSLAAVKRQAELTDLAQSGKSQTAGRAYETDDLPVLRSMALSAGYAAVLVFALYIDSENVAELYARPEVLWLVCPLLIYWISRIVMKTHRGLMTDDPIVYAATDRISQITVLLGAAIFLVAGLL